MGDTYLDRYRIASARLSTWDYASQALYFVTICTAGRAHYFGKIRDAQMDLSAIGRVAETEWFKTAAIRADMNVTLDVFCVMPNHVHMIVGIGANAFNAHPNPDNPTRTPGRDAMHRVSTTARPTARPTAPPTARPTAPVNRFGPQSKNLASIIRGYKSAVTTQARVCGLPFGWQPRYYDHIIRDDGALGRIRQYILNNPRKWDADRLRRA